MSAKKNILVYAHWHNLRGPTLMGILSATPARGKEIFSFEYAQQWLQSGFTHSLDPELQLYPGRFFPREEKTNFGLFLDSCPDRWGRVLMERKEAALAKQEERRPRHLHESDFLLGVYDGHRMGALRFKTEESRSFLNDDEKMAAPPLTSLRQLEQACAIVEGDKTNHKEYLKWLNLLIAPGSSLGGARPKASVIDEKKHLWIAKFPSLKDTKNSGAWEMVANKLALASGVNVPQGQVKKLNSAHHTFLSKRFDRDAKSRRIHFASAMTMLGYTDGADGQAGVSYLELAEFLVRHGANTNTDLEELWRRIVFSIYIKNTDDHLRNHGFLLGSEGWHLSPAYDLNPNEYGTGLNLNISETDNSLDPDLALSVAVHFRVEHKKALKIIAKIKAGVAKWQQTAKELGISRAEQDKMSEAFILNH